MVRDRARKCGFLGVHPESKSLEPILFDKSKVLAFRGGFGTLNLRFAADKFRLELRLGQAPFARWSVGHHETAASAIKKLFSSLQHGLFGNVN
jgi:hypothetical protein